MVDGKKCPFLAVRTVAVFGRWRLTVHRHNPLRRSFQCLFRGSSHVHTRNPLLGPVFNARRIRRRNLHLYPAITRFFRESHSTLRSPRWNFPTQIPPPYPWASILLPRLSLVSGHPNIQDGGYGRHIALCMLFYVFPYVLLLNCLCCLRYFALQCR